MNRFLHGMVVILITVFAVYLLYQRFTVLQDLERDARDFQARLRSPVEQTSLALVVIDDRDYDSLFAATSPLDPERLQALIRAVADGLPRAIGVDIATDDSIFAVLRSLSETPGMPPIIWARELIDCVERPDPDRACEPETGMMLGFAGDMTGDEFGIVGARPDPDGVIRRYHRHFLVGGAWVPSFVTALLRAAKAETSAGVEYATTPPAADAEYLIKYRPLPAGIVHRASDVLRFARSPDFGARGALRDKIVLLGGDYRAARDRYATPLTDSCGSPDRSEFEPGVCILAQVAQTEIDGGGDRPISSGWVWLIPLLDGVFLLFFFQLVSFPRAFWVAIVLIPALSTVSSLIFTQTFFGMWPYLVPLLIAVLLQQLYAHAIRYRNALIKQMSRRPAERMGKSSGFSVN